MKIPIESIDYAAGQLMRLSPQVEVPEPLELRRAVMERLKETSRPYGLH